MALPLLSEKGLKRDHDRHLLWPPVLQRTPIVGGLAADDPTGKWYLVEQKCCVCWNCFYRVLNYCNIVVTIFNLERVTAFLSVEKRDTVRLSQPFSQSFATAKLREADVEDLTLSKLRQLSFTEDLANGCLKHEYLINDSC